MLLPAPSSETRTLSKRPSNRNACTLLVRSARPANAFSSRGPRPAAFFSAATAAASASWTRVTRGVLPSALPSVPWIRPSHRRAAAPGQRALGKARPHQLRTDLVGQRSLKPLQPLGEVHTHHQEAARRRPPKCDYASNVNLPPVQRSLRGCVSYLTAPWQTDQSCSNGALGSGARDGVEIVVAVAATPLSGSRAVLRRYCSTPRRRSQVAASTNARRGGAAVKRLGQYHAASTPLAQVLKHTVKKDVEGVGRAGQEGRAAQLARAVRHRLRHRQDAAQAHTHTT